MVRNVFILLGALSLLALLTVSQQAAGSASASAFTRTDERMDRVLLAQTHSKPHWSRIEWAEQLLLHAYTRSTTKHSAPILTAIAFINWWEGRGSKAHQFLQLALKADPADRLARLSELMISSGSVAMSCRSPRSPA